jgi:CheY-like chemotaxis protein
MNQLPPTIVVVEDDADTLTFLEEFFPMLGMQVVGCRSALDAVACIIEHRPRVVILDVQIDSMTGVEVLHHLRADPTTQTIPVIFFTGSGDLLRQLLPDYASHQAYLVVKPDVQQLSVLVHHLVPSMT